jgi:hypothetical protein
MEWIDHQPPSSKHKGIKKQGITGTLALQLSIRLKIIITESTNHGH